MKKSIVAAVSLVLLSGAAAYAQGRVSAQKHANLAAAQRFIDDAIAKVSAAQQANEWDMSGHAKKAKELLVEANAEIKEAARAANKH